MITSMREYFKSLQFVLVIVIVAFVATSVVYFGAGSMTGGGNGGTAVATVDGEAIPVTRYQRVFGNYVEVYRQIYKDRLTPEMVEQLGLSQQVINDLIQDALVVQRAEREGIRVSDDELRAKIQSFPAFQADGQFSRDRYLAVLRRARLEAADFEAEQRRELQRRKMESLVRQGVKVSEEELRQAYTLSREKVRAAWAFLPTEGLLGQVSISDADAEPYLNEHRARFTRPPRRRLQYVVVSAATAVAPVSDAEAEAYFKEHAADFEKPRRFRAAHVLVRVPPTGGSEAEQKARARVEEVIRRVKVGEDFAKLAKEVSEDPASAPQGGDLGFVAAGELVPQFEEALFALKKGEVSSAPVRTPFGYHAIKVVDIEEGGRPAFKDVARRIKDKLLGERSDRAAQARAEEARTSLQAAKDFAAEAQRLGLEPRAATIGRGDSLEGIGREPALEEAVFSLALGGISSPVKTAGGYALVRVEETIPAGVPPLAEIKDQVLAAARREKAGALGMERAQKLVAALSKGGDFAAAAKAEGFAVGETPLFSRQEPPREGSAAPPGGVLLAATHTPAGQVAEPVRLPAGVYVVKTLERQQPDPKDFEQAREELRKEILAQKQTHVLETWLRGLRAQAKVEITGQGPAR